MPVCHRCEKKKPAASFPWRDRAKTKRHSHCVPCGRAYHREWYARNKKQARKRLNAQARRTRAALRQLVYGHLSNHPCVDCGEADLVVLDFDHVRGEKKGHIGVMANQCVSVETLEAEIAKCEIRCANCHRRKTAKVAGWAKLFAE